MGVKGHRHRLCNKEKFDACPLWANLEKKKMEDEKKIREEAADQIQLTPHGEKEASSGEVFMDKTPEEPKDTSMDRLSNMHGE